ncbi:MAG: hypothetical protein KGV59_01570 [Tenacibaculum sp.]|nr:hypothetical protein [Tenacibaculum sp.]
MSEEIRMKFITVVVSCKNHGITDETVIYRNTFTVSYEGKLNVNYLNEQVYNRTPKNICCEQCGSTKHNSLSYSFTHTENL